MEKTGPLLLLSWELRNKAKTIVTIPFDIGGDSLSMFVPPMNGMLNYVNHSSPSLSFFLCIRPATLSQPLKQRMRETSMGIFVENKIHKEHCVVLALVSLPRPLPTDTQRGMKDNFCRS
jgi:hypothetical protein